MIIKDLVIYQEVDRSDRKDRKLVMLLILNKTAILRYVDYIM